MSGAAARGGLLVIGIGNADRADDGVGALVAARLSTEPGVRVLVRSGDALALLEDWADADAVILVDAAAGMSLPGTIHRVDALADPLPAGPACASTHDFGVAETIALARALDRLPERLVLYAIEGASFQAGAPLAPQVAAAAERAAEMIIEEIRSLKRCDALGPAGLR